MKHTILRRTLALILALAVAVGTPLPVWAETDDIPQEETAEIAAETAPQENEETEAAEEKAATESQDAAETEPSADEQAEPEQETAEVEEPEQETAEVEEPEQETPEVEEPEQETAETEEPEQAEIEETVQEVPQAEDAPAVPEAPAKRQAARAPANRTVETTLKIVDPAGAVTISENQITVKVRLTDADGNPVAGVKAYVRSGSKLNYEETDANGEASVRLNNLDDGANTVYAYTFPDKFNTADGTITYTSAESAPVTVTVQQQAQQTTSDAAPTRVEIVSLKQTGADGSKVTAVLRVTDENGNTPENVTDYKYALYTNTSKSYGFINNSDGTVEVTRNISGTAAGTVYDVYAELWNDRNQTLAQSEHITITAIKPTVKAADVTTTPSIEDQATGTITVAGDYQVLEYYKYPNGATKQVTGTTITGLEAGTYYVASGAYSIGNTYYVKSGNVRTVVEEVALQRYNLTLHREGTTYWWSGNSQYNLDKTFEVVEGESLTYRVVANNDYVNGYVLDAVTVTPEDNADVTITKDSATSWTVEVTNITGNVTLSATARQLAEYTVTLADGFDGKVKLNDGYPISKIREDQSREGISIVVTDEGYKLVDVTATNADVAFDAASSTFSLSNLTGDVVITPVLEDIEVYAVTLNTLDGKVSWGETAPVSIKENERKTFELTLKDDRYTLDDVTAENADALYNERTGEVTVSNATGAVELIPVLTEKEYTVRLDFANENSRAHAQWEDSTPVTVKATSTGAVELNVSVRPGDEALYLISAVEADDSDAATVVFDAAAGKVTVTDVRDDVTLSIRVDDVRYTVTLAQDENAVWTGASGGTQFDLKVGNSRSVWVKPSNADTHYITGVTVSPEGNAEVSYSSGTGEVFIQNITGDITLTPVVVEKSIPATLEVAYHFNENGLYSEENPAVQVTFYVTVRDQFGETVPGVKLYFKDDENEVSFTQARTTDADGVATFGYSYGISVEVGDITADYNALFALDSAFTEALAEQDIHLVLQRKSDLVLYEHQIVGTAPGESNGKLIDVPAGYEIWTGEVHQGALVIGSGEWVRAVDGQITGLSAGQHILRAGEYVDETTNTFYFASDYADFFIPRGVWTVTVDLANSEHVIFTGETEQTAEPGGTVYVYVTPEEGYEITTYTVDKPGQVSGGVRYSEANGFVVLDGVTYNVTLTVIAEKKEEEEPPVYTVLEGSGGVWTKGSEENLHFKADGAFDKFNGILVDGETVDEANYDASSGSTNVELKAAYLETLATGEHTLTFVYTDGQVSTAFTIKDADAPETPAEEEPVEQPETPAEEEPAEQPETPAEEEPAEQPETPAEEEPAEQPETPAEEEPAEQPETPAEEEPTEPETPAEEEPETERPEKPEKTKSSGHKAKHTGKKSSAPKTGDEGQIERWALLAALSLGSMAAVAFQSRTTRKREDRSDR